MGPNCRGVIVCIINKNVFVVINIYNLFDDLKTLLFQTRFEKFAYYLHAIMSSKKKLYIHIIFWNMASVRVCAALASMGDNNRQQCYRCRYCVPFGLDAALFKMKNKNVSKFNHDSSWDKCMQRHLCVCWGPEYIYRFLFFFS